MSIGASGGKGGSSSDSANQSTSSGSTTSTPANAAQLQQGYGGASDLLGSANWGQLAGTGASDLTGANTGVTNLNNSTDNAVTGITTGAAINNPANADLTSIANGSQIGNNNPNFQNVVNQTALALQPQIDGSMAAAGRYGSGADANAFASALTNETGQMAYNNYTNALQNQLTAAGQLGSNYSTGVGQQLQGASLTPGLTTSALTPGTTLTGAGTVVPLAAQQIFSVGDGGTTTSTGAQAGTGSTNGTNWNVNGSASANV